MNEHGSLVSYRESYTQAIRIRNVSRPKQRLLIPHMFARAMQEDGWILRDECVWFKPNPMPSCTTDRTTCAHEFLFMFSKKARYYYDGEAIKEKAKTAGQKIKMADGWDTGLGGHGAFHRDGREKGKQAGGVQADTRNRRSVWRISTKPYKGSHYATFPPKLVEPCVLAGTSAKGCCPACWAPWVRVVRRERVATRPGDESKVNDVLASRKIQNTPGRSPMSAKTTLRSVVGNRDPQRHVTRTETVGWAAGCDCDAGEPVPCVVLDPFVGSGTTLQVANEHGRRAIGCDLDERNLTLIRRRMELVQPLLTEGTA